MCSFVWRRGGSVVVKVVLGGGYVVFSVALRIGGSVVCKVVSGGGFH